jgi:hypothetical protein
MNQAVRDKLCQMLVKYGPSLVEDPRRCEALLRDLCPQDKREVHVLLGALRERVPAELAPPAMRRGAIAAIGRLTKRLEQNLALAEEPARWAVESWALALGVVTPKQLAAAQPRKPKPQAAAPPVPPPVIRPPAARAEPGRRRLLVMASALVLVATVSGAGLAWKWPQVRGLLSAPNQPATPAAAGVTAGAANQDLPQSVQLHPASTQSPAGDERRPALSATSEPPPLSEEELEIVRGAERPQAKIRPEDMP